MKFLLLLGAVFLLLWMLRGSVRRMQAPRTPGREAPAALQPMVCCAHCGVHLPHDEALPGRGGVFCDAAHRSAFEQAHPGP
jgi:uncharacterized protein